MADRFCPKCGDEVKAGSTFCAKCGHQLGRKRAKSRMSRKARLSLTLVLAISWVIGVSLLVSKISISRVDSRCGGFFDALGGCTNYSSATFNLGNPNNWVAVALSAIALYLGYRLWLRGENVKKRRVVVLLMLSLITIWLSVSAAYQGEQKNDHALLPKCNVNLDTYIATGSTGCGAEVDNAFKTKTFAEISGDEDNNDSAGTLAVYWLVYTALAAFIVLKPSKKTKHEVAVE